MSDREQTSLRSQHKTGMRIYSMAAVVVLAGVEYAQAAPPPNDNFTNRIVLTGTDVSFNGTLADATVESNEIMLPRYQFFLNGETESVWWDWTAPESASVVIQVSNPSQPSYANDGIAVYSLSNISSGQVIAGTILDTHFPDMFFSFEAVAGTDYQIQLAGSDAASFHFRLLATNSPCIIEQPRSQTISVGDSVLFTVVAASGSPKGYQWQFNTTNLPGETAPMLALDQPDPSQAGPYRVIVTNTTGAVTSQVAALWITQNDTTPTLSTAAASTNNEFDFSLLGDMGRRYRILSSTNLGNWLPEESFPTRAIDSIPGDGYQSVTTSVVLDWTGADGFALQRIAPLKLFRASTYHAQNEVCNNHLKQIWFATLLFAYDNHFRFDFTSGFFDIMPYFKGGNILGCPAGGIYISGAFILNPPTCTIEGHVLEEP